VLGHHLFDITIYLDQKGMAACSGGNGFTWHWGQQPKLHWHGHCNTTGF
jgi:hypothetical protein